LAGNGENVCILSRGYGRQEPAKRVVVSDSEKVLVDARTGGDEPVELASKLIGKAAVIADRDRVGAAAFSRESFGSTTFVLDDGFQHRQAVRDVDIVCIDATSPFGNREILPAGSLRERTSSIKRADIVVITRADLVENVDKLRDEIKKLAPEASVFAASNVFTGFRDLADSTVFPITADIRAFAFGALGNPSAFFDQLKKESVKLIGNRSFGDHYFFEQHDLDDLAQTAQGSDAEVLITTAKDAVRLSGLSVKMRCVVAEIEVRIDDEERFRKLILDS
jgi:tetraacyldisaccharide 4'-kinase